MYSQGVTVVWRGGCTLFRRERHEPRDAYDRESAVALPAEAVAVLLLVRTLPMFRTAQTLHNTNKASEQTTALHRSLGTPRGGPLCNVAGAHRVAAADEEIWLPDASD